MYMGDNTLKINKIPALTWNWLKMNDAAVMVPSETTGKKEPVIVTPDEITVMKEASDHASHIPGGMGDEFEKDLHKKADGTLVFSSEEGKCISKPVVVSCEYEEGAVTADRYMVRAGKGSRISMLIDFSSDKNAGGFAMAQTVVEAEADSIVKIVQINRLGNEFTLLNDVAAVAHEGATIEIVNVFLGGKETYQGCRIDLSGTGSGVKKDIGYFLKGSQKLDMNYVVDHKGKKSNSDIKVSGVMEGESEKLFRGTIDFKNGCAGAKGAEIEEVILRDDGVVNKTIPVILCAEEDVEGSHGATIGRLDEDLIFYMQTRGFEEEEIYRLISRSKLVSFCDKILDEDIRNKTMTFLSE